MRFIIPAIAAFALIHTAASAQSMNAETFHKRATALQKKGAMAIFSAGEIKALTNEGKAAALRARELRLAAVRSGAKPRYCPPEGPQRLDSSEFMQRLTSIPAAERARIDMTEATTRILAANSPARASLHS